MVATLPLFIKKIFGYEIVAGETTAMTRTWDDINPPPPPEGFLTQEDSEEYEGILETTKRLYNMFDSNLASSGVSQTIGIIKDNTDKFASETTDTLKVVSNLLIEIQSLIFHPGIGSNQEAKAEFMHNYIASIWTFVDQGKELGIYDDIPETIFGFEAFIKGMVVDLTGIPKESLTKDIFLSSKFDLSNWDESKLDQISNFMRGHIGIIFGEKRFKDLSVSVSRTIHRNWDTLSTVPDLVLNISDMTENFVDIGKSTLTTLSTNLHQTRGFFIRKGVEKILDDVSLTENDTPVARSLGKILLTKNIGGRKMNDFLINIINSCRVMLRLSRKNLLEDIIYFIQIILVDKRNK